MVLTKKEESILEIQRARTPEEQSEILKNQAKEKFEKKYQESAKEILGKEGIEQNLVGKLEQKFEGTNDIERSVERLIYNDQNINLTTAEKEELKVSILSHILGGKDEINENKESNIDISSLPKEVKENPDFPILKLALDKGEIDKKDFEEISSKMNEKTSLKDTIAKSNIDLNIKELLKDKIDKFRRETSELPKEFIEKLEQYGIIQEKDGEGFQNNQLINLIKQNYNLYYIEGENKDKKNINITIEIVFNILIHNRQFIRDSEYFRKTEKVLRGDDYNIGTKIIYLKSINKYLSKEFKEEDLESIKKSLEQNSNNGSDFINNKPKTKLERVQELLKKSKENGQKKVENELGVIKTVRNQEVQEQLEASNDPDIELEKKIA